MSQFPPPVSSSEPPRPNPSCSNFNDIFEKALKEYKKKTGQDLTAHPLAAQLQACDTPAAILTVLQDQVDQFNQSRSSDERLQRWLNPTINVLLVFAETIGEGISLAFSPAKVIFVGAGVLLQAAKVVEASQDLLIDVFERIENFFRRLEVYTTVPPTPAMTNMMVNIMVEVLDILGTATKEMKQSRAKKFLKKIAGITKLEDGLKKLDKMTTEEARMANAEALRLSQTIDKKVEVVDERVQGVGGQVNDVNKKVEVIDERVLRVDENVKAVKEEVQTVIDDGKQAAIVIQKTAYDLTDVKRSQLREKLRQWQSPSDPSMNHNLASDLQHKGTAGWFCGGSKFEKWKVSGSLLWIYGKPGSGKSILCSAIINDIETLQKTGLVSMAYFYFDFRDTSKQSRGDLLRSLLVQLSAQSDLYCDILSRLYDECGKGTRQPSDGALMRCLKEMLTLPDQCPTYLIMDALDECPNTFGIKSPREKVLDVVKELVDMRLPSLRICVTSRPEVNIRSALEGLAFFSMSLHEESGQQKDIAEYIKSVVHAPSDTLMWKWREEHKNLVIQTLLERADGMFRWVFCQLETLRHCLPQNVRRVLSQLPASLDETYERILKEIGKTNDFHSHRLLQCLTVAKRPLRVEELAEILALDFDAEEVIPELKENWRWQDAQEAVLSTCSSLIDIVDVDNGYSSAVQFAHFSVKEFLTSDRLATSSGDNSRFHILPEPAHTVIAKACLGILLRPRYDSPLFNYAKDHWVGHARFEKAWTHVEDGIRRLFDPAKPYLGAWIRRSSFHALRFIEGYNCDKHRGSPLYYASLCGFRDLAALLISENPQHVTGPFGQNPTPLVAALHCGHVDIAELLYQAGADLNIRNDDNMTLLHAASDRGLVNVAKWLFKHCVPTNSQRDDYERPIHLTEADRHPGHVISIDEVDDNFNTPLHLASQGGHFETVRELLIQGADVTAQNWKHMTPLHLASNYSYTEADREGADKPRKLAETLRLLISRGADVTALDMTHSTPLHLASVSRIPDIVRILLENSADVNAKNENHSTPLHRASLLGCPESIRLLIESSADVTAQDSSHMTPLHLASSWDNVLGSRQKLNAKASSVLLLINYGADVTAQDMTGSTPLHMASSWGSAKVVQLLIEHGADVTAQNKNQLTPLHLALSCKYGGLQHTERALARTETVRLLIEHGADVTARDEAHSTPLHLAASDFDSIISEYEQAKYNQEYNPKADTVRHLIKHGADVSAQDKKHSTPLHFAAFYGSFDTVLLLLEHGADITALDGGNKTPLHQALSKDKYKEYWNLGPTIYNAKAEIARLLIEHGADVTTQDESHSTPLHLASSFGVPEIVQLLIEHGVDITAQDASGRTPLHLASSLVNHFNISTTFRRESDMGTDTVRLLIGNGADIAAKDETHSTPLHLAAFWGSAETVRLLIEHGADVTAHDGRNRTPLHLASSKDDSDIMPHYGDIPYLKVETVRLLIKHGAEVTAQDESHSTPLHMASCLGLPEIMQLLIKNGADITARDRRHRTPLHLASSWVRR
ncbi:Ankyrin repeat-containing domain protein [Lactarius tabidus]